MVPETLFVFRNMGFSCMQARERYEMSSDLYKDRPKRKVQEGLRPRNLVVEDR